jgi:hypothetical protein
LGKGEGNRGPQAVADILATIARTSLRLGSPSVPPTTTGRTEDDGPGGGRGGAPAGRFDFDLAEFPLFRFCRQRAGQDRGPLVYSDTITGRDGRPVAREWRAFPGPFGYGGATTQVLLYDLLQLYAEQGFAGSQIQFGTLRSLFLRRGERNPGKRDYERMRRDFDILRGYDFHCKNAFWDHGRRAYADMNWRLFGAVFYFKGAPDGQEQLPFGFVEVSSVLRAAARGRGLFALGFGDELFYRMRPLEQRLAVYLAKKFVSQRVHRRPVEDLARALPIEASRPRDATAILKSAAQGLLHHGLPILADVRFELSRGRAMAEFHRKAAPRQDAPPSTRAAEGISEETRGLVERIAEQVGGHDDLLWWARCAERLGRGGVDRALGQLKEAAARGGVRNPGGLLTKIFKDIAAERGVGLT